MSHRNCVSIFVILASLIGPFSANAANLGSVTADVTATETVAKYKWNSKTRSYEASEMTTHIVARTSGTGQFSGSGGTIDKVETRVPGIHFKGYSRVTFLDKKTSIVVQSADFTDDVIDGVRMKLLSKSSVETIIASGTMEDFKAGGLLQLVPTPRGRQQMIQSIANTFAQAMMIGLKQAFGKTPVKLNAKVINAVISENVSFEMTATELTVRVPNQEYGVEVKVAR